MKTSKRRLQHVVDIPISRIGEPGRVTWCRETLGEQGYRDGKWTLNDNKTTGSWTYHFLHEEDALVFKLMFG